MAAFALLCSGSLTLRWLAARSSNKAAQLGGCACMAAVPLLFDANAHTIFRGTSALFAALAACKLLLFAFAGSASPLPRTPEALSPLQFALVACLHHARAHASPAAAGKTSAAAVETLHWSCCPNPSLLPLLCIYLPSQPKELPCRADVRPWPVQQPRCDDEPEMYLAICCQRAFRHSL